MNVLKINLHVYHGGHVQGEVSSASNPGTIPITISGNNQKPPSVARNFPPANLQSVTMSFHRIKFQQQSTRWVLLCLGGRFSPFLRQKWGVMRDGPHVGIVRSRDPPWYPWRWVVSLGCSDKGKSLILASEKKDSMLYTFGKCPEAFFTNFKVILPTHFYTKVWYF